MQQIWAEQALLTNGWRENVRIEIANDGRIQSVTAGASPGDAHRVGVLLPAPANSHSHAFQRAMAGLTERRAARADESRVDAGPICWRWI